MPQESADPFKIKKTLTGKRMLSATAVPSLFTWSTAKTLKYVWSRIYLNVIHVYWIAFPNLYKKIISMFWTLFLSVSYVSKRCEVIYALCIFYTLQLSYVLIAYWHFRTVSCWSELKESHQNKTKNMGNFLNQINRTFRL